VTRLLIPLLGTLALAWSARAQSALFLLPEATSVELGGAIRLSTVAGTETEGAPEPWPGDRIAHFFARTASTQENRDDLAHEEGLETSAVWPAEHGGVLLLGIDLEPVVESVASASFREFVDRTAGETARAALGAIPEAGEIAILHSESAKALLRVEDEAKNIASIATSKTGQPVEIRPLMDPTALRPGADLAVRLHAKGPGGAGGVVIATNTTTGVAVRSVADSSSIANIHIESGGRWRLEFHVVEPNAAEDVEAEWIVHTATLTFDVTEEDAE
jgi:hypothetical protein